MAVEAWRTMLAFCIVASAAPGQELTGIFNINYPADGTQAPRLRF